VALLGGGATQRRARAFGALRTNTRSGTKLLSRNVHFERTFFRYNAEQRIDSRIRRFPTGYRRGIHGQVSKHNCNWRPSGRGHGYVERYVSALLAGDKLQVSMCLTKDRYFSQESAQITIVRREAITRKSLRLYHCPYCSGYHLTSSPMAETPEAA